MFLNRLCPNSHLIKWNKTAQLQPRLSSRAELRADQRRVPPPASGPNSTMLTTSSHSDLLLTQAFSRLFLLPSSRSFFSLRQRWAEVSNVTDLSACGRLRLRSPIPVPDDIPMDASQVAGGRCCCALSHSRFMMPHLQLLSVPAREAMDGIAICRRWVLGDWRESVDRPTTGRSPRLLMAVSSSSPPGKDITGSSGDPWAYLRTVRMSSRSPRYNKD